MRLVSSADIDMRTEGSSRLSRLGILAEPMGYVDGLNLYEYVTDNPINRRDPTGRNIYIKESTGAEITAGDVSAATFIATLNGIVTRGAKIEELDIRGHGQTDHIQLAGNPNPTVLIVSAGAGGKLEVHVVDALGNTDITALLDKSLAPGANIGLHGCHTGEDPKDGWIRGHIGFARTSPDSLAGQMSKALKGTIVTGIKKMAMPLGTGTAVLGTKVMYVDGKEI